MLFFYDENFVRFCMKRNLRFRPEWWFCWVIIHNTQRWLEAKESLLIAVGRQNVKPYDTERFWDYFRNFWISRTFSLVYMREFHLRLEIGFSKWCQLYKTITGKFRKLSWLCFCSLVINTVDSIVRFFLLIFQQVSIINTTWLADLRMPNAHAPD